MSVTKQLLEILEGPEILILPGCYDALSAKLVERAGFSATFMGGFAVSASRLGLPDTGLISYAEMVDQGANICGCVSIPVFGDGDTGYGNALNVKRRSDDHSRHAQQNRIHISHICHPEQTLGQPHTRP